MNTSPSISSGNLLVNQTSELHYLFSPMHMIGISYIHTFFHTFIADVKDAYSGGEGKGINNPSRSFSSKW